MFWVCICIYICNGGNAMLVEWISILFIMLEIFTRHVSIASIEIGSPLCDSMRDQRDRMQFLHFPITLPIECVMRTNMKCMCVESECGWCITFKPNPYVNYFDDSINFVANFVSKFLSMDVHSNISALCSVIILAKHISFFHDSANMSFCTSHR